MVGYSYRDIKTDKTQHHKKQIKQGFEQDVKFYQDTLFLLQNDKTKKIQFESETI